MSLNSDALFTSSSSSSPLTCNAIISTMSSNKFQKLPVAMATNEYIHVWFKGADQKKYCL